MREGIMLWKVNATTIMGSGVSVAPQWQGQ